LAGIASLVAGPRAADAPNIRRIGFLGLTSPSALKSQLEGLRELGYVEGRNITIEWRWAEEKYERLPELAGELVRLKVDVLLANGTAGTRAAKEATANIPIVMVAVSDPVATGLVASYARSGGNITGPMYFVQEPSSQGRAQG